jgi:hypothetical protein
MVALNSKANTIEIYAPEEQVKPLKPQILKAAGASLSRKLIFVYKDSPVPAETAQTPGNSVSELYILDAKNQAYIKADTNAANMINGLTENAVLLKKALPVREGTALVFLEDGTRLSYFFEENGDLNVNGACYRVQPAAREAFEKKLAELKASPGASKHPKWLAWMQAENITTISSGKAQDYRDIRIESGKRLALADIKPPENARKAEISFKSGVKYTLTFAENTLNIISSDLDYACAYTLSPQTRTQ